MTETFSVEQFEKALPQSKKHLPLFVHLGVADNEHCFAMPIGEGKLRILIRSSVKGHSGKAAETGEDSIRIIVQRKRGENNWHGIGKGVDAYTQRTKGWELRLRKKIKEVFYKWRDCKQDFTDDDDVFMTRKGLPENIGRVFATNKTTGDFRWLSEGNKNNGT